MSVDSDEGRLVGPSILPPSSLKRLCQSDELYPPSIVAQATLSVNWTWTLYSFHRHYVRQSVAHSLPSLVRLTTSYVANSKLPPQRMQSTLIEFAGKKSWAWASEWSLMDVTRAKMKCSYGHGHKHENRMFHCGLWWHAGFQFNELFNCQLWIILENLLLESIRVIQ